MGDIQPDLERGRAFGVEAASSQIIIMEVNDGNTENKRGV